jgi:cyclohexyl-isocyanide hydratase
MMTIPATTHLHIGAMIFPDMDQCDVTGPFEVLSRVPNSTFHILWKEKTPIRDTKGFILTPEKTFAEAPQMDVLVVPGGGGQIALMEDKEVLSFIRRQAAGAKIVLSVCTGSLTVAAAGLLKGVKTTTHWASVQFLEYFDLVPINERVVVDGKFVSAAGVTSGIDGALRVAAILRGDRVAQEIQLYMQYAPEPPFNSGSPETAPPEVLASARAALNELTEKRQAVLQRIGFRSSHLRASGQ